MTKTVLDKLGRIVIPKNICKQLRLEPGSSLLISLEKEQVVITPEQTVCAVCGERIPTSTTLRLCRNCFEKAKQIYNAGPDSSI